MSRILKHPWLASLFCLMVILAFHSPRWWIFSRESPGTFEWDRALTYLKQCQSPFRDDVEPAMRWRFIPQVIVCACGGGRPVALVMPWLGVWALLVYLYRLLRSRGNDEICSAYMTIVLGSSGPVLVSTGWLGMNDAWVALGLCYLAFGHRRVLLAVACTCGPFIDERFIFGIPCAIVLRNLEEVTKGRNSGYGLVAIQSIYATAPFVTGRLVGLLLGKGIQRDGSFLLENIHESMAYLWVAPLGGWMALRFAYLPVFERIGSLFLVSRSATSFLLFTALVPVGIGFFLATDTMRTAGILLPLCIWGTSVVDPGMVQDRKRWAWLAVASLIVPAAYVTYTKVVPINSFPIELWRLLR